MSAEGSLARFSILVLFLNRILLIVGLDQKSFEVNRNLLFFFFCFAFILKKISVHFSRPVLSRETNVSVIGENLNLGQTQEQ